MPKKMNKADKAMSTIIVIIAIIALITFTTRQGFKPFAITSGNLDYVKSKCGNPFYNVYQCGSYYCIDSLSGRCVDVDVNCKNAPVVYNCLNLGGGTGCTKSGNNLLIDGKIVATDSCSNPTLAVIQTAYKTLYLCKGVSPPSNFVAVSGDLGGYVKYQGSDPSCSTQCPTITEKCPDGSIRLQDSHCNLLSCPASPIVCGNGICDSSETQSSCSSDCIPTFTCYFCKNGILESGKWQGSCPSGTSAQQLSFETPTPIPTPTPTPIPIPIPTGCPLYSPLQCGADEELVPFVDSAGCPTSKCVKVEGLAIWIYVVIIGVIILGVGGIFYFNKKKK